MKAAAVAVAEKFASAIVGRAGNAAEAKSVDRTSDSGALPARRTERRILLYRCRLDCHLKVKRPARLMLPHRLRSVRIVRSECDNPRWRTLVCASAMRSGNLIRSRCAYQASYASRTRSGRSGSRTDITCRPVQRRTLRSSPCASRRRYWRPRYRWVAANILTGRRPRHELGEIRLLPVDPRQAGDNPLLDLCQRRVMRRRYLHRAVRQHRSCEGLAVGEAHAAGKASSAMDDLPLVHVSAGDDGGRSA